MQLETKDPNLLLTTPGNLHDPITHFYSTHSTLKLTHKACRECGIGANFSVHLNQSLVKDSFHFGPIKSVF